MGTRRNDTLEQGSNGGVVIDDTTATSGNFGGMLVITDAVINTWDSDLTNASDLSGKTLIAGLYIPSRFENITLTSGTVICYNDYE